MTRVELFQFSAGAPPSDDQLREIGRFIVSELGEKLGRRIDVSREFIETAQCVNISVSYGDVASPNGEFHDGIVSFHLRNGEPVVDSVLLRFRNRKRVCCERQSILVAEFTEAGWQDYHWADDEYDEWECSHIFELQQFSAENCEWNDALACRFRVHVPRFLNPPGCRDRFDKALYRLVTNELGLEWYCEPYGGMERSWGVIWRHEGQIDLRDRDAIEEWIKSQRIACHVELGDLEPLDATNVSRAITERVFDVDNLTEDDRRSVEEYKRVPRAKDVKLGRKSGPEKPVQPEDGHAP